MPNRSKKFTKKKPARKKPAQAQVLADPRQPSEVTDEYFIFAYRKIGRYPKHSAQKGGKWLLFIQIPALDAEWNVIKRATEEGKLGGISKVATARHSSFATNSGTKVICVYTYDWTDEEDVRRIRAALRELDFIKKIPYKADKETRAGRYAKSDSGRISKYYE